MKIERISTHRGRDAIDNFFSLLSIRFILDPDVAAAAVAVAVVVVDAHLFVKKVSQTKKNSLLTSVEKKFFG